MIRLVLRPHRYYDLIDKPGTMINHPPVSLAQGAVVSATEASFATPEVDVPVTKAGSAAVAR